MRRNSLASPVIIAGGLIIAAVILSWPDGRNLPPMLIDSPVVTSPQGDQQQLMGRYRVELYEGFALAVPAEGSTAIHTVVIPYDNVARIAF